MKLDSIVTRKPLLESIQYGMTPGQRRIVEGIVREFMPLYEATLTKDQIDQLFGTIEKDPSSRTMIGKGVDVAKKANEVLGKVGKWMQDETPVKGFDEKFEQLKKKISDQHPELAKKLTAMGTWAKENPGKTAAIIGVLTSIAGIASGGTGGAIAGQVLRGATELLKGEKLSTAIGKGLKTAAAGYAVGKIADMVKDYMPSADTAAGAAKATSNVIKDGGMWDGMTKEIKDNILKQYGGGDWTFKNDGRHLWVFNAATGDKQAMISYRDMMQHARVMGYKAAARKASGLESVILQQRPLSEGQVYLVFQRLDEGPFDAIKKVAGKAAGAVGGAIAKGAEKIGTALTQKNTAQGLAKAWTKAGSPTDSDELYKFLLAQKINKDALDKIYGDMKFPVPQNVQEPEPEAEPDQGATDAGGTATARAGDAQEPEATGGDVTGAKPSTATATDTDAEKPAQGKTATGTPAPTRGSAITSANVKKQIQALADQIRGVGPKFVDQVRTELAKSIG